MVMSGGEGGVFENQYEGLDIQYVCWGGGDKLNLSLSRGLFHPHHGPILYVSAYVIHTTVRHHKIEKWRD